jgi:hypothetical protein
MHPFGRCNANESKSVGAQLGAAQLAGVVADGLVHDLHAAGHLVADQLCGDVRDQRGGSDVGVGYVDDRVHPLPQILVRQTDDGAGTHRRVRIEGGLDLGRVDVGAPGQDEVLAAIR